VDVRRLRHQTEPHGHLITFTPIPATLQSCREARNHGLYDRVFFEVDPQEKGTSEQRYVWLNLDIDVVDIGTSEFRYFAHIASAIKWVKFERKNACEYFYHKGSLELLTFTNAKEIHVVCVDGFWTWGGCTDDHPWPAVLKMWCLSIPSMAEPREDLSWRGYIKRCWISLLERLPVAKSRRENRGSSPFCL
jgi:hypothetical protein